MRNGTGRLTEITRFVLVTLVLATFTGVAGAFINPNFTPVHLTEQSDLILLLKFEGKPDDKGMVKATVTSALKGEKPDKPLTFDLFAGAFEAQGQAVVNMIAGGATEVLLFIGSFDKEGGDGGMEGGAKGMLNINGQWVIFFGAEENLWEMEKLDAYMQGTWAGSTDMLLRAIKYILSDENADVPIKANAEWGKHSMIAKLPGKINSIQPVDLKGDGKLALLVACDSGDKLFENDGKKFTDVTAKHKLTSKSKVALWLDGKLLSWNGKKLSYAGSALTKPGALKNGCTSLGALRSGDGKTTIIIGTSASPETLTLKQSAPGTPVKLVEGDFPGKDFGPGGKCLVVDFDGDSIPDIVQIFESGGLFYKGKSGSQFAAPAKTRIALGRGASAAQLGDYDANGLMDVFTSAEDTNRIWHNLGKGQFVEMFALSGEITYISKSGGIGGATGDINNDGRQDVLITYTAMAPQIFFNRGYRSFGHARALDLSSLKLLEESHKGQDAGCLADFNGDGAQDMTLALKNGELWIFPRNLLDGNALSVNVAVEKSTTPVLVTGWSGKRCLGAWNVTANGAPAFFGLEEAGRITLKWRFPGGKEQTKEIVVIDGPVRFVLPPGK